MTEALQQETLQSLAMASFTKMQYAIFPKWYAHNQIDPDRAAFLKNTDGTYDFTRPGPAFWQRFEQRVLDLQEMGIEAERLDIWEMTVTP